VVAANATTTMTNIYVIARIFDPFYYSFDTTVNDDIPDIQGFGSCVGYPKILMPILKERLLKLEPEPRRVIGL
jgi:hypothetical protein